MSFRKKLVCLVVISSLIRLLIAATIELGNDEVYYYTYALHLQWNYFDHTPGVALLIRLTTLNLLFTQELFFRLGSVICCAAGTLISYQIGILIRNKRTGWYAAVLYNTSLYTSLIAGTFILPDSPQAVFWLAALWVMTKMIVAAENQKHVSIRYWLLFGMFAGLCTMCKVHGIFLWAGLGSYTIFYNRKLLTQPGLYISVLITLAIISPIVFWNVNNHFVTWQFHSNRVEGHHINVNSFFQATIGQFFYNNPINVGLICIAIYRFRSHHFLSSSCYRILLLTGVPIVLVVTLISLFNPVLPHWSGPGFMTLSFLAAAYLDNVRDASLVKLPFALRSSVVLISIIIAAGTFFIKFYPGTIGSKQLETYGSGDFTLDLSGWKDFEKDYKNWLSQSGNQTKYKQLKIVSDKWFPAGHLDYYIAEPTHTTLIGVGTLNDLHNFAWLNKTRPALQQSEDALCMVPSNYFSDPENFYKSYFSSVQKLHTFTLTRGGKLSRYFTVYLLTAYKGGDEVHTFDVQ